MEKCGWRRVIVHYAWASFCSTEVNLTIPIGCLAVSDHLLDLARIAAMRGGAADGIGRLNADGQVDVGAVGINSVVPG